MAIEMSYKGAVMSLDELNKIQNPKLGDAYIVKSGSGADPDPLYVYDDGWKEITIEPDRYTYHVLMVTDTDGVNLAVEVEVNRSQGHLHIIDIWPYRRDDPMKRLSLLSEVADHVVNEHNGVQTYESADASRAAHLSLISQLKLSANFKDPYPYTLDM